VGQALKAARKKVEEPRGLAPVSRDRTGRRAMDRLSSRPGLLPPPEEQKDVKTAIGAARACRSAPMT
jgi:hypothetical protein